MEGGSLFCYSRKPACAGALGYAKLVTPSPCRYRGAARVYICFSAATAVRTTLFSVCTACSVGPSKNCAAANQAFRKKGWANCWTPRATYQQQSTHVQRQHAAPAALSQRQCTNSHTAHDKQPSQQQMTLPCRDSSSCGSSSSPLRMRVPHYAFVSYRAET